MQKAINFMTLLSAWGSFTIMFIILSVKLLCYTKNKIHQKARTKNLFSLLTHWAMTFSGSGARTLDHRTTNYRGTMEKTFELLTFEELLKLPIDIESYFDTAFEPPQKLINEWQAAYDAELDEVPTFYVTEGDGPLYFYYGNTRIKVSEHFSGKGKPIGTLLEDVIRCSAARQTVKAKEN